jgi:hypothetical protein
MSKHRIRVERPTYARRGSTLLIVVVEDAQGTEVFRDRADLNAEKARLKVADRIAQVTGDNPDTINRRLLEGLARLAPPAPSGNGASTGAPATQYPYEATPGGLIWNKKTAEGVIPTPLTTFTATITGQVVEDSGAEARRLLEIEATMRGRTYRFQVPAGQFASMNWPMEHMGAGAALWPGFAIKRMFEKSPLKKGVTPSSSPFPSGRTGFSNIL